MDLPSRSKWYAYSRARDQMLESTDTGYAPWYIVRSDDKRRARLNLIAHFLGLIPYKERRRGGAHGRLYPFELTRLLSVLVELAISLLTRRISPASPSGHSPWIPVNVV